jgi:hypothetical protein
MTLSTSPQGVPSTQGPMEDVSAQNIDAWDALSHGDDPTIK